MRNVLREHREHMTKLFIRPKPLKVIVVRAKKKLGAAKGYRLGEYVEHAAVLIQKYHKITPAEWVRTCMEKCADEFFRHGKWGELKDLSVTFREASGLEKAELEAALALREATRTQPIIPSLREKRTASKGRQPQP